LRKRILRIHEYVVATICDLLAESRGRRGGTEIVIARSDGDEAIQTLLLIWIASLTLAMMECSRGALRPSFANNGRKSRLQISEGRRSADRRIVQYVRATLSGVTV
jgi:hypothetical protein